jgi:sec-independent protein translocase protein TatA
LIKIKNMYSLIYSLGMIGAPQIILIVVVVLLLFGGRKIPELMRGLGSGIKEFKNATKEDEDSSDTKSESK